MNEQKRVREPLFFFSRAPFFWSFVFYAICELPWMIAFYPGMVTPDSCGQLLMCIWKSYNNHHPIGTSFLMYGAILAGRGLFQSDNAGIFLYVAAQGILQALAFSYCHELYRRKESPKGVHILTALFYCFVPIFMNQYLVMAKDTGYYLAALFCLVSSEICFLPGVSGGRRRDRVIWVLSLVGLCLFRQEGKLIAIFILLLCVTRSGNRDLARRGSIAVLLFLLCNSLLLKMGNIRPGSIGEALSVPALATAAYVDRYYDEMSPDEVDSILGVFDVGDIRELTEGFSYEISDDVKGKMKMSPTVAEMAAYLKIQIFDFFRHPGLYVTVYFRHMDGYVNPLKREYEDSSDFLYLLGGESRSDEYLDLSLQGNLALRELLRRWVMWWDGNRIAGLFFHPGLYFVLGCAGALWGVTRRGGTKILLWYAPALGTLLVLTLSPLNGSIRYALPLLVTAPVYLELATSRQ